MSELKIAVSRHCPDCFSTHRNIVNVDESRFIDVAAIVLSIDDIEHGKLDEIDATGYGIPVFVATHDEGRVPPEYLPRISGVFEYNESVLPSMVASWKPQQATTKRSYARRFSARWWIMSTRATAHLTARGIRAANSSAVILPVISSWNTLAKRSSAPTYATRTWRWAIC